MVGFLTVVDRLIYGLPAPVAYIAAGMGLGRCFRPLLRGTVEPLALQAALGLGTLLFLSHGLAALGLFAGGAGPYVALTPIVAGLALGAHQCYTALRHRGYEPAVSPLAIITAIGVPLLLVAACSPPGALWGSEFGGYDVLEYHLQLPQEWLVNGRLAPLHHNVFSYLPSYLEAGFMHIGAMTFAPQVPARGSVGAGLLAGDGDRLIACQMLHALFTLVAAWLTSRLSHRVAGPRAAPIAFGLVLLTPWAIVTGSMAYNEMALLAMLSGALIVAMETGIAPWRRALLTGLLCGIAASIKPTGLLFVGVPAGVVLLGLARPREWAWMVLAGSAAGVGAMFPWLLRNYVESGNPVFPFGAGLFPNATGGTGRWTLEQAHRYTDVLDFQGGVIDRLRLLALPEPAAGPGGAPGAHRGMLHPQWGAIFPMTLLSIVVLPFRRGRESLPYPLTLLTIGLGLQVVLWLFASHLQSRFLLPLLPVCAVLSAAGVVGICERVPARLRTHLAALPLVAQLAFTVMIFLGERQGSPNSLLVAGPGLRTGQAFDDSTEPELRATLDNAPPELFINLALPPATRVFLLGDATPLYITRPTVYSTTFDASPLAGAAIGEWNAIFARLRVDVVLVNLSELTRLERSGWNQPGITAAAAAAWMEQYAVPITPPQRWERQGVYLVQPLLTPLPQARPSS